MFTTDVQAACPDAQQISGHAMQTIDTVTNLANSYMTFIAVVISILALVGVLAIFSTVRWYSKVETKKIADKRINLYVDSQECKDLVRTLVEETVSFHMSNRIFTAVQPTLSPKPANEAGFKSDPKRRGKTGEQNPA
ncbi:hypothetical protein JDN40_07205 [Rhodomicrobium vannielii ATCC 17100]|uniref:hypothetical protein n=1 Tax=Rhodomicrobium vannielii TaxID=1069 RepID=UPI00191885FE|nr:hypothetical protein [Rhodomicrobium vannielii]MBJ7533887.1 hypothetical protein [Rhodomicrobium vannielii ATCC 17100]